MLNNPLQSVTDREKFTLLTVYRILHCQCLQKRSVLIVRKLELEVNLNDIEEQFLEKLYIIIQRHILAN